MAVLTLPLAKTHLNIPAATGTHDVELQAVIDAAEAAIGERVGPLEPTARTVRAVPTFRHIRVPGPAVSLTSITDADGAAITLSDLYLNAGPGLISFNDGRSFTSRYYTVVYSAGRAICPNDLLLAVKELVRHLWESQRGAARSAISPMGDAPNVGGPGYLLPYRVQELIAPHIVPAVG